MQIRSQKPTKSLMGRLATDYYLNNEKINGKSPLRKISLKKCEEGDLRNSVLALLDGNYASAGDQLDKTMNDYFLDFIGLYADNDHLIAHTCVEFTQDNDGAFIVQVYDIHIQRKEDLEDTANSLINFVYGIYHEVVSFVEERILEKYTILDRIDLYSLTNDNNFVDAVTALGYKLNEDICESQGRVCFSKMIRERNKTYERRNTDQ